MSGKKIFKTFIATVVLMSSIFQVQSIVAGDMSDMEVEVDELLEQEAFIFTPVVVTFDFNDGVTEPIACQSILGFFTWWDALCPVDSNPSRETWQFVDWIDTTTNEVFGFPVLPNTVESDRTVRAEWMHEPDTLLVISFDIAGGVPNAAFDDQQIPYNSSVTRPSIDPVRDGYEFVEWQVLQYGVPFDFSRLLRRSITITAIWEPVDPTVTTTPTDPPVTTVPVDPYPTQPTGTLPTDPPVTTVPTQPLPTDPPIISSPPIFPTPPPLPSDPPPVDPPIEEPVESEPVDDEDEDEDEEPVDDAPVSGSTNNNATNNNYNDEEEEDEDQPLLINDPSDILGISLMISADGLISISGLASGLSDAVVTLGNTPGNAMFGEISSFGEIFIIFPEGTDTSEIDVTIFTPADEEEWTYEYFDDVLNNVVLAILPPGVTLAMVLNVPGAPQPMDSSLLELPPAIDVDRPRDPATVTEPSEDEVDTEYEYVPTDDGLVLSSPQSGILSNSLALLFAFALKGSKVVRDKSKNKEVS